VAPDVERELLARHPLICPRWLVVRGSPAEGRMVLSRKYLVYHLEPQLGGGRVLLSGVIEGLPDDGAKTLRSSGIEALASVSEPPLLGLAPVRARPVALVEPPCSLGHELALGRVAAH